MEFKYKSVEEMSVQELIGQLIMVGLPSTSLDEEYKKFINDYKIGNFILFARNYTNTVQMKKFMEELYDYTYNVTGSFPLVSIDQEGGMVVRMFKDVTFPASPLTTSATSVKDAPYHTGYIIGKDMLKLGVNLNLAPCLEINEGLANHLVNVRGYGATKEIVLQNAGKFVDGIQDSGALSCLKHFPGAGSSTKDTHLELSLIEDDRETLLNYNMYPFLKLLRSDALMSSHCIFKSFEEVPTTLSYEILTNVLRKEVNYEGLIISDGMEMKAILDHYGIAGGTVKALQAGCDILLLCHDYDFQKEALDAVKEAIDNGDLSIELIKEKVRRINKAKEKLRKGLEKHFTKEEYVISDEEHQYMQNVVDESYTLVKGKAPYLNDKTLIITPKAIVRSIVEDEFDSRDLTKSMRKAFPNNDVVEFKNDFEFVNEILNISKNYENILIYSYDAYNDEVQKETINKLLEFNQNVYVVSIKGPTDQQYFRGLVNYACLYEYTPNSIRTIIKQLKEKFEFKGKLPL